MKRKKFIESWKNDQRQLSFAKGVVIALLVVICAQGFLMYSLSKSRRTVLLPANTNLLSGDNGEGVWVDDYGMDPKYTQAMGSYLVSLVFSFTPYNIDSRFRQFLTYVPPSRLTDIQKMLDEKKAKALQANVSESFVPSEFHTPEEGKFFIRGALVRYASGRIIDEETLSLEVSYKVINGGFEIEGLKPLDNRDYDRIVRSYSAR